MKLLIALLTVLFCLPLLCLGGEGIGLRDRFIQATHESDTIKKRQKRNKQSLPDTINVNYDNGKLTGPNNLSKQQLKELSRQSASELRAKLRERRSNKRSSGDRGINAYAEKQSKADSLMAVAANQSAFARQLKPRKDFPGARIHSEKKIKELYDSVGVDKMDTVLALAKLKKPVSEDELMDQINSSMASKGISTPAPDFSKMKLRDEALQELTPLSGRSIKPNYKQIADSMLTKVLTKSRLDSTSFPDSITHANGAKIIPYQNQQQLDSLKKAHASLPDKDSLIYMPSAKLDSIKVAYLHRIEEKKRTAEQALRNGADSLNNVKQLLSKESLKQNAVTDKLSEVPIPMKGGLFDRLYFEGIFSFNKGTVEDELRVSPAVGFMFSEHLSAGAGINLLISKREKDVSMMAGYRLFTKYQFFNQRAYLQLEDWIDPSRVKQEGDKSLSRHSILAGAGYVLALGKSIGLNGALLYRVNNNQYSHGDASPWVIRIGISSIRSKHK